MNLWSHKILKKRKPAERVQFFKIKSYPNILLLYITVYLLIQAATTNRCHTLFKSYSNLEIMLQNLFGKKP